MRYAASSRFALLLLLSGVLLRSWSTAQAQPWPECCIEVTHIRFNHDFASLTDGINIRPTSTSQLQHNLDGDGEWIGPPYGNRNEQACWVHNAASVEIYVRLEIYSTVSEDECALDPLVPKQAKGST